MYNAIFHKGEYLLLPEEYQTFEAFMADLRSRELPATCQMISLREDNRIPHWTVSKGICMAPYFLTGYRDKPVSVVINDPGDVYPTQVERMSQEEYNARLRTVIEGYCEGCLGYKPLTPRVQSLNGHHEEISLNGVCFYRYESKPSPRSFRHNLQWLGGGFMRYNFAGKDAEEMRQEIKQTLYVVYDSAVKTGEADGSILLTLTPKKKELLPPYLALALGHYLHELTHSYRVEPAVQPDLSPDAILSLAAPERLEAFRKECKKYGVSLAELTWDGQDEGRIMRMLWEENKPSLLYPIAEAPGRAILLLMDTGDALTRLRFFSPMLEAYSAVITVHSQSCSRRYTINFDMPFESLD